MTDQASLIRHGRMAGICHYSDMLYERNEKIMKDCDEVNHPAGTIVLALPEILILRWIQGLRAGSRSRI